MKKEIKSRVLSHPECPEYPKFSPWLLLFRVPKYANNLENFQMRTHIMRTHIMRTHHNLMIMSENSISENVYQIQNSGLRKEIKTW